MNRKLVLVILDGFGISKIKYNNAIAKANMTNFNKLFKEYPSTLLSASGKKVGLPFRQCGNSEVGHTTIGAGRIVDSGLPLLNKSLWSNEISENIVLKEIVEQYKKTKNKIHLIGLYSNGNVHCSHKHINKMIDFLNQYNIIPNLHLISDGRDTSDMQFLKYYKKLKTKYLDNNLANLVSISGRYYAMDRDLNWDLTIKTSSAMTGTNVKNNVLNYLKNSYNRNIYDYKLIPTCFDKKNVISKSDIVIYCNYRSDRIKQLIHYQNNSKTFSFKNTLKLEIKQYSLIDIGLDSDIKIIFNRPEIVDTLCTSIISQKQKILRVAETEKKAHVTFFMDGMKEFNSPYITNKIFATNRLADFSNDPKMKANDITKYIVNNYKNYKMTIANYANLDMIGHTGNFNATIKSAIIIDKQIQKLYENVVVKDKNILVITADHGNAEKMFCFFKPFKKHTTNKIPFIIVDDKNHSLKLFRNKSLTNITNTILEILDYNINIAFDSSIIKKKEKNVVQKK